MKALNLSQKWLKVRKGSKRCITSLKSSIHSMREGNPHALPIENTSIIKTPPNQSRGSLNAESVTTSILIGRWVLAAPPTIMTTIIHQDPMIEEGLMITIVVAGRRVEGMIMIVARGHPFIEIRIRRGTLWISRIRIKTPSRQASLMMSLTKYWRQRRKSKNTRLWLLPSKENYTLRNLPNPKWLDSP